MTPGEAIQKLINERDELKRHCARLQKEVLADQEAVQTLIAERDGLKRHYEHLQELLSNVSYPPGHFYSPVVDVNDTHAIEAVRFRDRAPLPAGVRIDHEQMTLRLQRWAAYGRPFPFPRNQSSEYRFYFDNPLFGCHDASALFSILMEFRPRRVVEVGCGFSSSLLLDVNERVFENRLDITLIDPSLDHLKNTYEWLHSPNARLLNQKVQDVSVEEFERLERNDILFIDSSHVSKTGSDVNHYLFQIVPRLKPGVLVHIHDILFPFEYLEDWVLKEKRSWNEAYLIHAFLQFNQAFDIIYWANFAWHRLQEALAQLMPLCLENEGGSLWLQRRD
jgi:predicted O-methyltransferase YrrM